MLVGYACVSTQDQKPELQLDALKAAGCEKVFVEKASGAQHERPELKVALDYMHDGETHVVWKPPSGEKATTRQSGRGKRPDHRATTTSRNRPCSPWPMSHPSYRRRSQCYRASRHS